MNFQIGGRHYDIRPEDIVNATRDVPPNPADGRNKYFVMLHGRQYPIKQVLQLVTGLAPLEFTAQYAHRVLTALEFEVSNRPSSATDAVGASDGGGEVL